MVLCLVSYSGFECVYVTCCICFVKGNNTRGIIIDILYVHFRPLLVRKCCLIH